MYDNNYGYSLGTVLSFCSLQRECMRHKFWTQHWRDPLAVWDGIGGKEALHFYFDHLVWAAFKVWLVFGVPTPEVPGRLSVILPYWDISLTVPVLSPLAV